MTFRNCIPSKILFLALNFCFFFICSLHRIQVRDSKMVSLNANGNFFVLISQQGIFLLFFEWTQDLGAI